MGGLDVDLSNVLTLFAILKMMRFPHFSVEFPRIELPEQVLRVLVCLFVVVLGGDGALVNGFAVLADYSRVRVCKNDRRKDWEAGCWVAGRRSKPDFIFFSLDFHSK